MLDTCWFLLATVAIVVPASAIPPPAGHVVHEERDLSRDLSDHGWIRGRRIEPEAILPVRIGLAQTNLDKGHDMLTEVSHPDSPKYGQWWTADEVHDFFAPTAEALETVRSWIKSVGISGDRIVHSENKGWLAVDATVAEAELLFATTYHEYTHSRRGDELHVGTDRYHLPEYLARHIDYVTPGVKTTSIRKRTVLSRAQAKGNVPVDSVGPDAPQSDDYPTEQYPTLTPELLNCTRFMKPYCLRALYGIPENPQSVDGNSLGIYSLGDYFDQPDADLNYFNFAQEVANGTQPIPALINGGQYDTQQATNPGSEVLIDLLVSLPLIYPQNVTLYMVNDPIYANLSYGSPSRYVGWNSFLNALDGSYCTYSAYGQTGNDPRIDPSYPNQDPAGYQGQLMCGVYKPTKVISISFADVEGDLPSNYQRRACNEFLKLGLLGTTVVTGTSDSGAQGTGEVNMGNNSTVTRCLGPQGTIFNTNFPSSCPYCLAVGATRLYRYQTVLDRESILDALPEEGLGFFTSGGGFSNVWAQPDWQQAAVKVYLDNYIPPYPYYEQLDPDFNTVEGIYNRIGRATPDISASGFRMLNYVNGDLHIGSGTSLATPLVASMITLVNQERALAGKTSAGFVNAVLYSHPEIFNDIVNGTNGGCGTKGFPAAPGWDATSGLGSPRYEKLRDVFLALP